MTDEAKKNPSQPGTESSDTRKPPTAKTEARKDDEPAGKVYDSQLIRRLGAYLKPYWAQAVISSISVTLKSLSDVAGPYLVKVGIDRYLSGKPGMATNWLAKHLSTDPWHGITQLSELYLGALLCAYLFEFIQVYLMQCRLSSGEG